MAHSAMEKCAAVKNKKRKERSHSDVEWSPKRIQFLREREKKKS